MKQSFSWRTQRLVEGEPVAHRGLGATCSLAEGHANHAVSPAANTLRLPDASPAGSGRILVPGHTHCWPVEGFLLTLAAKESLRGITFLLPSGPLSSKRPVAFNPSEGPLTAGL